MTTSALMVAPHSQSPRGSFGYARKKVSSETTSIAGSLPFMEWVLLNWQGHTFKELAMVELSETARRGRPRRFDVDAALVAGQEMFHRHGYSEVGIAALTERLGIKASSFYAAFGSKAAFLERILKRYVETTLSLDAILSPERLVYDALSDLLMSAAGVYAADPDARGCLVLETARDRGDQEGARLSRALAEAQRTRLRDFVAREQPALADEITDFVATTMSGLSANARQGWSAERLSHVAQAAVVAIGNLMDRRPTASSQVH